VSTFCRRFKVQSTFLGFQKLRKAGFWLIPAEEEAFKRGAVRTAGGKPWTEAELKLLMDMAAQGFNPQQIYDSGRFPERTVEAINKQLERCRFVATRQKTFVETMLCGCTIVITKPGAKVITIEPVLRAFTKQYQLTSDACPYFSEANAYVEIPGCA